MEVGQHSANQEGNKHRHHEGPKNHYLSFALSIVLTLLSFIAVMAHLGRTFTLIFIVILAIVQVLFQLGFWMHMKEKGHFYPLLGIVFGAFVALTGVITAVYWLWW